MKVRQTPTDSKAVVMRPCPMHTNNDYHHSLPTHNIIQICCSSDRGTEQPLKTRMSMSKSRRGLGSGESLGIPPSAAHTPHPQVADCRCLSGIARARSILPSRPYSTVPLIFLIPKSLIAGAFVTLMYCSECGHRQARSMLPSRPYSTVPLILLNESSSPSR